jgi:hypothetical protein
LLQIIVIKNYLIELHNLDHIEFGALFGEMHRCGQPRPQTAAVFTGASKWPNGSSSAVVGRRSEATCVDALSYLQRQPANRKFMSVAIHRDRQRDPTVTRANRPHSVDISVLEQTRPKFEAALREIKMIENPHLDMYSLSQGELFRGEAPNRR